MAEVFGVLDAITPVQIWDGVTGRPIHGAKVTIAVIDLEPNVVVAEHHHLSEQVGVLISGSATVRVGDETRDLSPGGTWCIPEHVPHEFSAGAQGAKLVECFAPSRETDWAGLDRLPGGAAGWPAA